MLGRVSAYLCRCLANLKAWFANFMIFSMIGQKPWNIHNYGTSPFSMEHIHSKWLFYLFFMWNYQRVLEPFGSPGLTKCDQGNFWLVSFHPILGSVTAWSQHAMMPWCHDAMMPWSRMGLRISSSRLKWQWEMDEHGQCIDDSPFRPCLWNMVDFS